MDLTTIISDLQQVPQTVRDVEVEVQTVKLYMVVTVAALAYLILRGRR